MEKGECITAVEKPELNAEDREDGGTRRTVWQQEKPEHRRTL